MGDFVQPFEIEGKGVALRLVRGRFLRLDRALSEILGKHDYPPLVAGLLGETLCLAALLAAALKYDGIFTLQARGAGPVKLLVADVASHGALRAYAQFDAAAMAALGPGPVSLPHLLGAGHLAFTVDQGEHTDRYQGIVELIGANLVECVQHYFRQSEQIAAGFHLALRRTDAGWQAGAIMLQRLPAPPTDGGDTAEDIDDAWRRAIAFLASAREAELLGPDPAMNALLYRLFHEDGVRVSSGHALRAECRCSAERVERMLRSLPEADLEDVVAAGFAEVTCEFCAAIYRFSPDALRAERADP